MSKRKKGNTTVAATAATTEATAEAMEQRVVAFAEQLGRIVGTVQAKTEGWMDRDALNKQIASVRDSAAALLDQLADGVTSATKSAKKTAKGAVATAKSLGRSGGIVDAPGKKHRKPAPKDPRALAADAKRTNMRANETSMKTMKKRGRG
jgi:uncharacterized phage infection (PIP) family protein YhgE